MLRADFRWFILVGMLLATPGIAKAEPPKTPGYTFRDCSICPEMVVVPIGKFEMGDLTGDGDSNEKPVHLVKINYRFAVGKFEVSQSEWRALMRSNPSRFKGDDRPVEHVSWKDAKSFLEKLNAKTGNSYRLLSESEWEYVARSGGQSKYSCGDSDGCVNSSAWYRENSNLETHSIGQKKPNKFNIYDIHGNVAEWVEDCWSNQYRNAPTDGSASLLGECELRVIRGGHWNDYFPQSLRSAARGWSMITTRNNNMGFRIALTISD